MPSANETTIPCSASPGPRDCSSDSHAVRASETPDAARPHRRSSPSAAGGRAAAGCGPISRAYARQPGSESIRGGRTMPDDRGVGSAIGTGSWWCGAGSRKCADHQGRRRAGLRAGTAGVGVRLRVPSSNECRRSGGGGGAREASLSERTRLARGAARRSRAARECWRAGCGCGTMSGGVGPRLAGGVGPRLAGGVGGVDGGCGSESECKVDVHGSVRSEWRVSRTGPGVFSRRALAVPTIGRVCEVYESSVRTLKDLSALELEGGGLCRREADRPDCLRSPRIDLLRSLLTSGSGGAGLSWLWLLLLPWEMTRRGDRARVCHTGPSPFSTWVQSPELFILFILTWKAIKPATHPRKTTMHTKSTTKFGPKGVGFECALTTTMAMQVIVPARLATPETSRQAKSRRSLVFREMVDTDVLQPDFSSTMGAGLSLIGSDPCLIGTSGREGWPGEAAGAMSGIVRLSQAHDKGVA